MGDGVIVLEIFLAAFAVIGFYSVLRLIGELIFPYDYIDVAVRLYDKEQIERLDVILDVAASRSSRRRGEGLVVLISSHLMTGAMGYGEVLRPELEALLRSYGADCFVVDIEKSDIDKQAHK